MKKIDPHLEDKVLVWMLLLMVFMFGLALGIHVVSNSIVAGSGPSPEVASKVSDTVDLTETFRIKGGSDAQRETIHAAFALLSQCERDAVNKRLHVVVLHKVPQKDPKETVWGGSYRFGIMELDDHALNGDLLRRVFIHECGHYFDWQYNISEDPRFVAALREDYSALTPRKKYENHYIKDPSEAAAEMFSFHFTQRTYFDTPYYYEIELFPHAYGVFDSDLRNDCNGAAQ